MDFSLSEKHRVIDLFCGCGGLSEGFRLAGYEIVGGADINQPAIDTYRENFKEARGICGDLLAMGREDILRLFGSPNTVDVLIGGPPCQGFSSANRHQKEAEDPRNRLFFQFVKFVDIYQPLAILIENVPGIVTRNNGYAAKRIQEIFSSRGYTVSHAILNATDYGVPQHRRRNFFVMLKGKHAFDFSRIPKANAKVTIKEAIGELYGFENNRDGFLISLAQPPSTPYQKYLCSPDNLVYNHEVHYPADRVQERIRFVPQGGNWEDVPKDLWPSKRDNRHSSCYKRLSETDCSCTIDTGNAHSNYFHPLYDRIPTPREAARLQSFPDSFHFVSTRGNNYRQIGNAVPPLLAKALAVALAEQMPKYEAASNKILDLFCGCGGMSLGFEQAGFAVMAAIDLWEDAIRTYNHNHPHHPAVCQDICT